MPMFDAITPVRRGGKTIPPGKPVELDDETGAALVALGAVSPSSATVAPPPPAPPPPPPPLPPVERPLSQLNRAALLAIAKAEGVGVADDATNKVIVAAIEAKRAAAS